MAFKDFLLDGKKTPLTGRNGEVKISKFEWGTPEGTAEMKRVTPGETTTESKEADYGSEYQQTVKRVGEKAKAGPMKTIWVPAKYGTGGKYKVVPVNDGQTVKVKESIEAKPMYYDASAKVPYLLMTNEQRQELHESHGQLEFDGIQTKHLDQCPLAFDQFKLMIADVRAGKHLGELTGHETEKTDTGKVTTQNSEAAKTVETGIALKPDHIRRMQFRQYTGI